MKIEHSLYLVNMLNNNINILSYKGKYWFRWVDILTLLQYKHHCNPYQYSKGNGTTVEVMANAKSISMLSWLKNHSMSFDKYKKGIRRPERCFVTIDLAYELVDRIAKAPRGFVRSRRIRAKFLLSATANAKRLMDIPAYRVASRVKFFVELKGEKPCFDVGHHNGKRDVEDKDMAYHPIPAAPQYMGSSLPNTLADAFLSTVSWLSNAYIHFQREKITKQAMEDLRAQVAALTECLQINKNNMSGLLYDSDKLLNRLAKLS